MSVTHTLTTYRIVAEMKWRLINNLPCAAGGQATYTLDKYHTKQNK